jgi:hypothetical protein
MSCCAEFDLACSAEAITQNGVHDDVIPCYEIRGRQDIEEWDDGESFYDWTTAWPIKFCPFCGKELQ